MLDATPQGAGAEAILVHWILMGSVAVAVLASMYIYLINRNFDYLVEAPCDAVIQECYERDCQEEECPPNEYEHYRVFVLSAQVYTQCSNDSCLNICGSDLTQEDCSELLCRNDIAANCIGPLLEL